MIFPDLLISIASFVLAVMITPSIIGLTTRSRKGGEWKDKTGLLKDIPLFGGVAIFFATIIAFIFFQEMIIEQPFRYILVSMMILFITGFVDDIKPLKPFGKLFLQVVAVFITVQFADVRVRGLHGLFDLYYLDHLPSIVVSIVGMLFIVNAYNYVDGIDGLGASLGIVCLFCFGVIFGYLGMYDYSRLALAGSGALAGFLVFNLHPSRIIMGDTGSMTVGFIIALMAVQLLDIPSNSDAMWITNENAPVYVFSILLIPVIDFVRVSLVRIINRKSPFSGDTNHLHHQLLRLGLNHGTIIIMYTVSTLLAFFITWYFNGSDATYVLFSLAVVFTLLIMLPGMMLISRRKAQY